MRKQFITALATVLTSSMIAIPVEAGNVMIGNRHTLWKWLDKLYKQLLS